MKNIFYSSLIAIFSFTTIGLTEEAHSDEARVDYSNMSSLQSYYCSFSGKQPPHETTIGYSLNILATDADIAVGLAHLKLSMKNLIVERLSCSPNRD